MNAFIPLRRMLRRAALAVAAVLAGAATWAADFPDRPLRLVVPYTPGGITDQLARSLAEHLRKDLGQVVVIDNKPGANTAIGAQAVASAPADGYTLLMATGATVVLNPLLYARLSYDPARDFVPVGPVAVTPLVLVVKPETQARNVADLIALAKAQPGKVNYASTGTGSSLHLAGELLQIETGTDMVHVPYKGSAPALAGVLGGETQFFVDSIGSSLPLIKGGKLRALAVTGNQRLPVLPEVPTVAEGGYPRYDVSTWFGIMAPARTPPEVVARLNAAISTVLRDKAFREQFEGVGLIIPAPMKPAEFNAYIKAESERWAPLIKAKKIVLE